MRRCTQCDVEKPFEEFHRSPKRKDGIYPWCKPCSIAKSKEYQNKPGRKEAKRKYDKDRSIRLADIIRAKGKIHYEANRERMVREAGEWAKKNPARRRAISLAYKARRRAIERAGMSGREFAVWLDGRNKVCHWCAIECTESYHVDHVMPLSKGGAHEAWNLVISCKPCNQRKSNKHPLDWLSEIGYNP